MSGYQSNLVRDTGTGYTVVMMNTAQHEKAVTGASVDIDNRAWDLAKELCAKDGITDFSKISAKAIWIKGVLACGTTGEVGVPKASRQLVRHECGTLLIQKPARGMFGKPELVTVTGGNQ